MVMHQKSGFPNRGMHELNTGAVPYMSFLFDSAQSNIKAAANDRQAKMVNRAPEERQPVVTATIVGADSVPRLGASS